MGCLEIDMYANTHLVAPFGPAGPACVLTETT